MSAAPESMTPNPPPGLPPVQPPSGRFIAQLFVVPGLIIFLIVLVLLGLSYVRKREREPEFFLQQLDSDNADIRWRGASDLAQILKRPEPATLRWKADPKFALDLADRLDKAFTELCEEEQRVGGQIAQSMDKDKELLWRKLRIQRDYVSFLASALGEFHVACGAPILCKIVEHEASPDLKGNTLQRRKALWSLMNLGENLKGFAKVPAEQQQQVIASLKEEAQAGTPRAIGAKTALHYLDPTNASDGAIKVDETLAACANTPDRFLRELIAMSFSFWDGPQAESALLRLAQDRGQGTLIRVEENE
jgi:hypothetical protein